MESTSEKERQSVLETYGLLNGGLPKKQLESIIKLASEICDTPVSLIDIVDEYNQRTIATYGEWEERTIPKEESICDIVVAEGKLKIIKNVWENKKLAGRLTDEDKERIRFYAGAPLKSPFGHTLGALCVIDSEPRELTDIQIESLQTLADEVMARLNLHRQAKLLKQKNKRLEKYSVFLKNSADILCIIDPKTRKIEDVNDDIDKYLGYSREQLIGRKFTDFADLQEVSHSDIDAWLSTMKERSFRKSIPISLRNELNKELWFQCTFTTENGKWYLTARNITYQREAEKRVVTLEDKFKKIAKATTDLLFEYNPTTGELTWSDSLHDILGYPPTDKHVDFDWWVDKVHPDDVKEVVKSFSNVLNTQINTWKASYRFMAYDGTYKYVLANIHIDRDEQGTPSSIIGALADISDLRKSELQLKSLISRLKHANHMADLGYWEMDLKTWDVTWSDEMYRILKADKTNVKPSVKYILDRCEPEEAEKLNRLIHKLAEGGKGEQTDHQISIEKSEKKYLSHIGELITEKNRSPKIIFTTQDITERKHREVEIAKALKEKETLLAEIHHRVKNNMAIISALLELKLFEGVDEAMTEFIRSSQSRIQSMAKIHEKLYQSDSFSHISFTEYVLEMIDFLKTSYLGGALDVTFDTKIDNVDLNINQAIPCSLIMNELITNALRHAFPASKNGTVTITVTKNGEEIRMTVEDDGIGLPDTFILDHHQSLGMTLIKTLSQQINAELTIGNSDKGCKCSVIFEKKEKMKGSASTFI